jgi:ketosteroid isomerase-like protein
MSQENEGRRRTAAERIAVRWPKLMHLTTASVLRLPRGSRLRRTLLERAAEAAYEAWVSDDYQEAARAMADPEIEVYNAQGAEMPVGMDDAYYGPDGYCQAMADWADSWKSWRVEIEDVVEVAPDKVLITGRHFGEGRASGVKIERWGAVLYTFRGGKIWRVDGYLFSDKEEVSGAVARIAEGNLEAAGQ